MKSEALINFPLITLTIIAMVLFLSVFVVAVVWTFRKDSKKLYSKIEALPLEGGHNV
jgi:hypothetical protein